MFEHAGVGFYGAYFGKCAEVLAEDGVMVLHSIGRSRGSTPAPAGARKPPTAAARRRVAARDRQRCQAAIARTRLQKRGPVRIVDNGISLNQVFTFAARRC